MAINTAHSILNASVIIIIIIIIIIMYCLLS